MRQRLRASGFPVSAVFWSAHSLTWDRGASPAHVAARTAAVVAWVRTHAGPGARVLDAGCATGTHALAVAAAGYEVTGVDHAAGMLRRARRKAARLRGGRVAFVQFDLARAGDVWPAQLTGFDVILCLGVLQCVADPAALLRAFSRALASGGVVLVEVKDATAPPPPSRGYSVASRMVAPLKAWASARGARPMTAEQLRDGFAAAGLEVVEDRSGAGWLRVAGRAG